MKLIYITLPYFFPDEAACITALLRSGLETLHLRKPQATAVQMEQLIRSISPVYYRRIVLHDHFDLASTYRLSGMTTRYISEANAGMNIYTFSDEINPQVERIFSMKKNIEYSSKPDIAFEKMDENIKKPVLFHIAHTQDYIHIYEKIIKQVSFEDCLVISHPYSDRKKKLWWKSVVEDERTGVTFDLYDIGIVFFDKKRVKEHRIVNFL